MIRTLKWNIGFLLWYFKYVSKDFALSGDQLVQLDRSRSRTCTEPSAPALRAAFHCPADSFLPCGRLFTVRRTTSCPAGRFSLPADAFLPCGRLFRYFQLRISIAEGASILILSGPSTVTETGPKGVG